MVEVLPVEVVEPVVMVESGAPIKLIENKIMITMLAQGGHWKANLT